MFSPQSADIIFNVLERYVVEGWDFISEFISISIFFQSFATGAQGGGEEDEAATLAKPNPSGCLEPRCGDTGKHCIHFGLLIVMR